MLIGKVNDAGQIVNLRDRPKRKRMNALRACHYLFDRLTLIGRENDSLKLAVTYGSAWIPTIGPA